jgi:hypothetical protein
VVTNTCTCQVNHRVNVPEVTNKTRIGVPLNFISGSCETANQFDNVVAARTQLRY